MDDEITRADIKKNFPRAILHFDGDAFFASVEQVMDYRLKGKPVITGGERGAATSLSYEAKARGVRRGMRLSEIKVRCPEAVIVASDYISYAIYANRMYSIVRTYTSLIEEYSIDECFAEITGLDEVMEISYAEIALRIKAELEESLGLTFGVGLAPTKTLAKVASKAHKPAGFTSISIEDIQSFLRDMPIHNVWGLGGASGTKLASLGAETALKFIELPDEWLAEHHMGKPYRDVWLELKGHFIKPLIIGSTQSDDQIGSIMSTRTFKPPSTDRSFIFSQLSKNVERVCEKARKHRAHARGMSFFLKTQEFTYHSVSLELTVPSINPSELLKYIDTNFDTVYAAGVLYRASGITIRSLVADQASMPDLFGETAKLEKKNRSFVTIDALNKRYGRQTVFLGSSLQATNYVETRKNDSIHKRRPTYSLGLEKKRKTLCVPYLGVVK